MKKIVTLLSVVALSSAAVAGPVAKTSLTEQEVVKLSQTQAQSQEALQVQAGSWVDDHGVVVVAAVVGIAALAIGIVALAND